jgi:hypothetical protein
MLGDIGIHETETDFAVRFGCYVHGGGIVGILCKKIFKVAMIGVHAFRPITKA